MDIGELRPRVVIDVEDDKNQVLSNSNVQASGSHDQIQDFLHPFKFFRLCLHAIWHHHQECLV